MNRGENYDGRILIYSWIWFRFSKEDFRIISFSALNQCVIQLGYNQWLRKNRIWVACYEKVDLVQLIRK